MASASSIGDMQAVTGADIDTCSRYLTATGGDVEAACQLFFAAQDDEPSGGVTTTSANVRQPQHESPPPMYDGTDDIGHVTPQVATTLADGGGGDGGGFMPGMGHHQHFATGPSFGSHAQHPAAFPGLPGSGGGGGALSLDEQIRIAQQHMAQLGGAGSAWSGGPPPVRRPPREERSSALPQVLRPPPYNSPGTLQEVMETERSRASPRWVLLVLVDDSFKCGAMNRDILRNDAVSSMLEYNFTLWERNAAEPAGQEAAQRYRVAERGLEFPAILIVNPLSRAEAGTIPLSTITSRARPGEAVGEMQPSSMIDEIVNFVQINGEPGSIRRGSPVPATAAAVASPPPQSDSHGPSGIAVDPNEDPEFVAALAESAAIHQQQLQQDQRHNQQQARMTSGDAPRDPVTVDDDDDDDDAITETRGPAAGPAFDSVDLEAMPADGDSPPLRLRVKMPSGPWNLQLPASLPVGTLLNGVCTKLQGSGAAVPESIAAISLLVGFPPRKIHGDPANSDIQRSLADLGVRSGDVLTPHW